MLPLSACSPTLPSRTTPPANLSASCAAIPPFEGKTADDLVGSYLDLVGIYEDCSIRHAGLAQAAQ